MRLLAALGAQRNDHVDDVCPYRISRLAQACRRLGHAALTDVHTATDHVYSDHRIALQTQMLSRRGRRANAVRIVHGQGACGESGQAY
jgi:hypothetical protein